MGGIASGLLLIVTVIIASLSVGCLGQKPTAMYVFGDSLVDVGNNNYLSLSLAKADFPHNGVDFPTHKSTGRFSNGKNAADFLAEKVGLPTSPPYLLFKNNKSKTTTFPVTGVSFASGGAGIFNETDELFKQSIPLTKQVGYFGSVYEDLVQQLGPVAAQQHLSKSLFAIVIGSNDIFGYFSSGNISKKMTPQQYVDQMVLTLEGLMKRMHGLGARKFVIAGVGAVGCCPSQRVQNQTEACNEEENYWSLKYNQGLKSMLQNLKSGLTDISYSYIEVYSVLYNFIQTPSAYGFTEIKAACCGLGNLNAKLPCVPISTYCSNRSDHLFWDLYHPTETATRILIDTFFDGSQPYVVPINVKQLLAA